ncbi:2'-5' RNA ligase superfamily protein [Sulfobacillus thermosulfidooxidans DSM 9293]|uniref:2'-5' RNA ligase superfamily protein n=1 Tax=Sulfobacillus thermosulfidooxidans (strain DSM 9293 / VKM B-1269 / AT-1) TaxID=929705 RepID=A0A1W1WJM2_SULTA|nr:2'-5' RNA ligase superfamily protein [Sulfobacillus thermosulfidooxidans DSM 9293]
MGHSVVFAIEVYFNKEPEQSIRDLWISIEEMHPLTSLNAIEGARPHISLAVCDVKTPHNVKQVLLRQRNLAPFPIRFDAVGCFPTTGTLFLSPVMSTPLWLIHEDIAWTLSQSGIELLPYYRPQQWTSHCSLGLNLYGTNMTTAFERIAQIFVSLSGKVTEIGIIEA